MGRIFCLMGKSSSGKDTVYKRLRKWNPEFRTIVLYTTRPARDGERDGETYFFVDDIKLQEMEEEGKVIEKRSYHTIHGIWTYFTADDGQIDLDRYDYVIIGTLESFQDIKEYYGEEKVIPIYIEVDNGVRLRRALKREERQTNPKYAEMCRRFLADEEDFSEENLEKCGIDRRFINHDLNACVREIEKYIKK